MRPTPRTDLGADETAGAGTRHLALVSAHIESVIEVAEKAVYAAGTDVGAIVEESQRQVEELAELLPHLDGDSYKGGIATAIERQTEVVRTFVEGLVSRTGQQSDTASRAAAMTADIASLASEVSQIAITSRVLSLNATVECARLGESGRAMNVIALEMQRLSSAVRSTNTHIEKLAQDLGALLPKVVEIAAELRSTSVTFSEEFGERQSETETSYRDLVGAVSGAFERSRTRVDRILKKSQDALSALQFQDPVAQKLRHALDLIASVSEPDSAAPPEAAPPPSMPRPPLVTGAPSPPELSAGEALLF